MVHGVGGGWVAGWLGRWVDGRVSGQVGWVGGWVDGWVRCEWVGGAVVWVVGGGW